MLFKLIINSCGVPCGVVRNGQIESWDSVLDEALALPPTIQYGEKTKDGMIIDVVKPGRKGNLDDILNTINLYGFYLIERDIPDKRDNSTVDH